MKKQEELQKELYEFFTAQNTYYGITKRYCDVIVWIPYTRIADFMNNLKEILGEDIQNLFPCTMAFCFLYHDFIAIEIESFIGKYIDIKPIIEKAKILDFQDSHKIGKR